MSSAPPSALVRRSARLAAVVLGLTGLLVFVSAGTGHAQVQPITDYASYPPDLPAGCPNGDSALVNVRFTANGRTTPTLYEVWADPGDVITMSWDGFTPACRGLGIGLSSKLATSPGFDASQTYWLYDFSYCGPEAGATACGDGPGSLQLTVPPTAEVPCYQLDAHVGPPLSVIGPSGSYYGPLNGVRDLLISAKNAGTGDCVPLPMCPTDPSVPAASMLCEAAVNNTSSTTTAPSTTTTTAPSTTTTTSPPTSVDGPSQPPVTVDAPGLPVTGRDSSSLVLTGSLFLLAGLCFAFAARRPDPAGTPVD